ncbi:hypothetical protein ACP70R_041380 [Stipagrostis hirtigluma subsp. patula]
MSSGKPSDLLKLTLDVSMSLPSMDDKDTKSIVVAAIAGADADARSTEPEHEQQAPLDVGARLQLACGACLRAAALVLVAYSLAAAAWRARREPRDLAFVAGAGAALGALLLCLRRAERLTPASPAGEWRRVRAAVWALTTALSCAFAYRVAAVMPPALAAVVWCMTALVVLAGFFMLVLCTDQQYRGLDEDLDCDAAGDRKPFNSRITIVDELV